MRISLALQQLLTLKMCFWNSARGSSRLNGRLEKQRRQRKCERILKNCQYLRLQDARQILGPAARTPKHGNLKQFMRNLQSSDSGTFHMKAPSILEGPMLETFLSPRMCNDFWVTASYSCCPVSLRSTLYFVNPVICSPVSFFCTSILNSVGSSRWQSFHSLLWKEFFLISGGETEACIELHLLLFWPPVYSYCIPARFQDPRACAPGLRGLVFTLKFLKPEKTTS